MCVGVLHSTWCVLSTSSHTAHARTREVNKLFGGAFRAADLALSLGSLPLVDQLWRKCGQSRCSEWFPIYDCRPSDFQCSQMIDSLCIIAAPDIERSLRRLWDLATERAPDKAGAVHLLSGLMGHTARMLVTSWDVYLEILISANESMSEDFNRSRANMRNKHGKWDIQFLNEFSGDSVLKCSGITLRKRWQLQKNEWITYVVFFLLTKLQIHKCEDSQFFLIVNWVSLGFGLLVRQHKIF